MLLDGKKLSIDIQKNVMNQVNQLKRKPKVIDIVIGHDGVNDLYIRNKQKACQQVGILFEKFTFETDTSEEIIIQFIQSQNQNPMVDAIMIQLPIPSYYNTNRIVNSISPLKDVDGMTDVQQLKLYQNVPDLIPCTPKGILKILEKYEIPILNQHIVVIGRGTLVGKPLIQILQNKNANITICHSKTKDISKYTKEADIIICATNQPYIIKKHMVSYKSIIIDAGCFYYQGKWIGNVDEEVRDKVKYITPVPGGVGPMTVAMFLENILICYFKNKD